MRPQVSFGGPIALMVIGAILAFATNLKLAGLDMKMIGWILIAAGLAMLVLTLIGNRSRARRSETTREVSTGAHGERVERVQQETDGPY